MCGEISGDHWPGDSSHEGATMAFFWMIFFSAQNGVSDVSVVTPLWQISGEGKRGIYRAHWIVGKTSGHNFENNLESSFFI